jgi:cephalosporin hydroxylase
MPVVEVGRYIPDAEQPPLSIEQAEVVRRFHDLTYRRWHLEQADTLNVSWFGYRAIKCPLDLWLYQELLVRRRPDLVVETGTYAGGSALFLAMILDHLGHGSVITIDIEPRADRPVHPRINYVSGSSVDPLVVDAVTRQVDGRRAFVILDSDHKADHVHRELLAYQHLVQPGDYLIVEDTDVNGHPVLPDFGPGPMEAVDRFLAENSEFVIDGRCERFLMTANPRGYLCRGEPASLPSR